MYEIEHEWQGNTYAIEAVLDWDGEAKVHPATQWEPEEFEILKEPEFSLEAYLYDEEDDEWYPIEKLPEAVEDHAVCVFQELYWDRYSHGGV